MCFAIICDKIKKINSKERGILIGKTAMCILMLQYLNSGRVYKLTDLADLLEGNFVFGSNLSWRLHKKECVYSKRWNVFDDSYCTWNKSKINERKAIWIQSKMWEFSKWWRKSYNGNAKNPSTYNTILSFGDLVEVVEPDWLKGKIKNLARTIYEKYTD